MRVQLLGNLPFDPGVVASGDVGRSLLDSPDGSPFVNAIDHLVAHVLERCESQTSAADVH